MEAWGVEMASTTWYAYGCILPMFLFGIWHNYLYLPLLNTLIYLYNGVAGGSMAGAVIILTLLLRVALLPLNILAERSKALYAKIEGQIEKLSEQFKNDPVERRERIRKLLKANHVNYWAKSFMLSIQGLVLILLYQVFIGGFNAPKLRELYSGILRPDYVNTQFFSFDIASRDWWWAATVGLILFLEIRFVNSKKGGPATASDAMYSVGFPLLTFLVLAALPMVKSLFILTSIFFSFMISFLRWSIKKVGQATD